MLTAFKGSEGLVCLGWGEGGRRWGQGGRGCGLIVGVGKPLGGFKQSSVCPLPRPLI